LYKANEIVDDGSTQKEIEDSLKITHNGYNEHDNSFLSKLATEAETKMTGWDPDNALHSFLWQYSILTGEEVI
jgi:hypothetical protein